MQQTRISDDVRRFIFALPSVPHLEAILLMRSGPNKSWGADALAKHLYISEDQANNLLQDLNSVGICCADPDAEDRRFYRPASLKLANLISRLASFYAQNIIEVTGGGRAGGRGGGGGGGRRGAGAGGRGK